MELEDYKRGAKYKRTYKAPPSTYAGKVLTCVEIKEKHVKLKTESGWIFRVESNPENWEEVPGEVEDKKPVFNPKRGDKVLIEIPSGYAKRIFLNYIEGALLPYLCVHPLYEENLKAGKQFKVLSYKECRPLPLPLPQIEVKVDGKVINLPNSVLDLIKKYTSRS